MVPDFFWNTDGRLWELPPRLFEVLQSARLAILKGDVNYRRATNDALWPPGASLTDAVTGFPAPVVLLRTLKSRAAREGRTLQEVANELLRQGVARQHRRADYRLELAGWTAEAQPGVDILDRDKLFDLMARG